MNFEKECQNRIINSKINVIVEMKLTCEEEIEI